MGQNSSNMHIAFCCDDNYIMPAGILLESVLKNNYGSVVIAHTFNDDLSDSTVSYFQQILERYQGKLVVHQVPEEAIEIIRKAPLAWEYLSLTTYYRLMLPYVLDDVDKILYLDCDVLVRKNIRKYYDFDIDTYYVAGAHDIEEAQHRERLGLSYYINAGVLLMNISLIRKQFSMKQMLDEMNQLMSKGELKCGDQDIINILFAKKLALFEDGFNYQHGIHKMYVLKHMAEVKHAEVIHFITADKPWLDTYVFPYTREYYNYLKKYYNMGRKCKYWLSKPAGIVKIIRKHKDWTNSL